MKLRTYISSICTLLLFLSVSLIADAALLPFSRRMQATPGNTLLLTSLDATKDVEVNPKTGAFVDVAVVNRLTLGVDKRTTTYFGSAINLTATVEVETFDAQNLSLGVTTHVLNVNYDPFSSTGYVDKQQITLSGAYKMIYKLVSVQENGTSVNHLKELFYIDADIFVERYEDFTQTMSTQIAFTSLTQPLIDTDCDGKADALRILWPTILGAEEYQLEWAHVNNYGYDQTTNTYLNVTKPANELEFDFKNNSTRISTSENYYDISLIYEKGWIVYRLRALGVNPSNPNQIITGVWNTNLVKDVVSNLPSTSKFELTAAHENLINWQYSATYAEQGKKKEIVSYFDGTMRYRQMVTKVNSDNNTIVGETIYDHQGRPAITVLPTPVNDPTCTSTAESSLHFYRNFNQNEQGENYSRVDFDISGGSNACNIDAKEMGTQSGSSQYYSPNNPDLSNENAYIPDAKKYPFTQIEYTPDNTGRIRRQSGVGEEFQLGSGHESKYFYGKPQQVELDRLFGSEVGVASHYQKNVVLDPNGQASISYLDQEGRVIATALAGDETPNLKVLESEAGAQATLTTDVFEYNSSGTSLVNKLNIDGDAIEFNSQLTVAYQSNYTFDYSFTIAPLAEDCLPSLCIDCVYDLTLEVKDECGTVLNSSPAINQKMVGKFTPTASGYTFHAACQAPVNGTDEVAPFTVQLGVGNYGITKVLRINEEAKQAYITNYLDPTINNCVLTLEDFQNEALSLIDTSGCEMTCQECLDQLGTLEDFLAAESGTQADYYELKQNCDRICNGGKISECEIKMNMMKIDMTPGGQYGEYELNGVTNVSAFALSVYNSSNLLEKNSASQGNWKFPKTVKGDGTIVNNYLNDDETQAYVLINFDGVNYIPSVVDVTALIDNGNGTFNSKPENLTNVTDFIENFEPSWAEGLLTYHPEYCYYEQCLSLDKKILPADDYSSYGFDDELVATTTFADAVTKGFIKSNWATITTPNARLESWFTNDAGADKWDPFVVNYGSLPNSGSTAAYNTQLSSKFNLYQNVAGTNRSMTEFAAYSTRCIVSPSGAPVSGSNCYNFGDPASAASVRDEEWNRLKTLYLSYKRDLIYKRGNEIAIKVCSGYNGCIGNENFNPSDNGFFTYTFPSIFNAQALNPAQPCALATAALYVDKQPRFTDGSYLNMDVPNEAAYLNYQLTGQCPTATNFEQLLASLITTDQLDNTGFNLNAFQPYNNLKLAANTYASPGTLPTTTYISTISGNTINATFTDGTVSPVTMTISKPVGSPAWDFFTNIYGLDAVGSSFTAQATYQLSAGATPVTVELNGTLNGINIANCSFEESCETYTFTRDVATLISAVAASGQITSASPVSITPLVVSGTPVSGVPSATIQTVAGSNNLVWSFNSSFKEFRLASSTANSLDGIFVKVVSTNPATFTNFAGILNVTDVQAEAGNTFTLQVQTTTGPATLTCSFIERSNNGVVKVELPAGACSLPTPLNCQNDGYENLQDLQALLEDVLINQPYNNASGFIDVSTSTAWVPNLQQVTGNPTAGFGGSIVNAGLNRLQKINMGSCSMELSYTLPASLAGAGFAEMVEMTDLEIGAISTPLNESFQFKFKGTFNLLGNVVVVPITGVNTCIPLRDCKPCDETVIEWDSLTYTTYENTLENSGDVVVDGTLAEYDIYVAAIDQLNTSNGWSVTDPLYVRAQTYDKFFVVAMNYPLGTYTGFILNYVHGLDDYTWLTDPNLFVINYGHSVNVEYEYKRYLLAIQRYNSKAQLFGMSTLTAIDLSTFANYRVADNTSAYIVYLEALPTSLVQGQNIIPYLNASNSTSTPATALYSTYVANYMTWRTSISGTPSFQQQLRYHSMYSYTSFDQNNLFCSTPGLQAATTYVNSFSASSTPVDFPSLATCTSPASATDIAEVQRRYIQYVNAIRRYNTSFWATTNNLRLTQEYTNIQTFTRANVAPCVESYEQYLEPYRLSTIANNPAPVLPQAFSQYAPCNQVSIKPEDPCKAEYDQYINCLAQYNAWAEKNYREGFIKLQFDYDKFKGLDLCRCVEEFCDRTSAMINGTAPFTAPYKGFDVRRYLDITLLCQENRLPCDQEVSDTQIPDMPELEIVDNCKEMMINQAYMSAQNNYENYLQNLLAELDEKYTTHCLSVKDHLNMTYDDKQYHYTLYYYDQAGNLIKTVPPAGVKSLDVSNASLLAAITADRDNGTKKVFTTHTLETRYEYNSLNQLVAQSMPDQDEMEIFEPVLANGVVAGFETKTIQMITESRGYMGGNVTYTIPGIGTSKRTYLYQTENGGQTWSRVHGLVGADLVKVEMASTTLGAAIGKGGVVLLTRDGGNSWDLLNTSQYVQFNTDLNDLVFVNNSGTFNLVVVGNKGLTARSANLTTANPTFGFINGIPTTQDVKSVVFDGAKYVCITNENTTLPVFSRFYNSIDINGISWTEEKSISNTTGLNDVTFISNSDAVAVGEDGRLYKCIGLLNTSFVLNTSARWVLVENNLVNHIKSVEFFDVNNAVALVEHSSSDRRLYRTIDGGSNWTQVSSFTKFNSITLDFQKQYALAVGDNGTAQVFTPNPNLSMDPIDIKTNLTSNLTSGWINRIGSGLSAKTEVILADASNKVYFTANAFNLNPSWISQNVTGSIILKAFKAKHFSTGAQEIKAVGISVSNTVIPFTINPSTNTIGMGGVVTSLSNASLIDLNYTNSSSEDDIIVYNNLSGRIAKIRISGTTVTTFGNYLAQTILHSPLANNPGKQFSSRLIGGIYRFLVIANTSVLNYASENSSVTNIDALSRTNYTNSLSPVNLKNIEMFAGNAIANGTDGQLYTRSSAALWSTVKLQSNNTINDVEVTSTTNELIVVGNGGYAAKGLLVSNAYAPISLNFAAGVNVTENINEVRLKSNVLYAAADQGKVFYSPTFTTTAITKLSHGAENLNGLCFKTGGTTAFFVGNNTTLHDVAGTNFLVKKDLFLPEFVDVHFSDLATGTLASSFIISATIQNAVLRTTQTAGVKWNYALPTSGVGPLVVKKVFTYNNQIRAVMGTNLHRIINNVVTEQTIGYLLNAIDVSSLPNTNTAYVLRGTSTRYVGTVTPNSTNTGLVVVANIPSATISANAQSIQAFADNSFIAVGNSGYSKYFRGLTSFDVTLPSGVGTPNLKDVTFFDYRNGVVVGDNGMFWKTTNTTVNPSGFLIGGAWKAIDAEGNDPYNLVSNNTLGFNFSAVAFAGPHYLVYGGAYSAAGTVAAVRRAYAPINRITARFFYDRLGRIVVSQNARQYNVSDPTDRKFSYTRYDELGRVFEAGEKQENADALKRFASIFGTYIETSYSPSTVDDDKLATWLNQNEGSNPTAKRREVTKSYYDFSHTEFVLPTSFTGQVDPSTQRKRIVHVAYESEDDMDPTTYDHATHYNYDIHGNVVTLLQDNHKMAIEFPSLVAQQFKRMDYTFDLISGNVHRMSYQDGEADQWHHAYEYDADNRITNAYTNENTPLLPNTASNYALANESVQNSDWQNDASYFYYQHGPLARTELGADHVQGSDYIYNLQGWMKGVNSTGLKAENDPGNDGLASSINEQFARDIYGFNLSYFKGDYQAIDATKNAPTATFYGQMANNTFAQASGVDNRSLWNGNIRSMQTTIADPNNNNTALPLLNTYEYDQLNRLSEARSFTNYSSASNEWGSAVGYNNRYYNAFTYDAMGNILSQKRHNDAGAKIEDLQYQYNYNNTNQLVQNRLYHVNEDPSAVADPESIEDMGVFTPSTGINVSNNYRYDAEGRLIQDLQEGIQNIIWRVDGKVKEIVRIPGFNGAATKNIRFDYDAMGHRIAKHVLDNMSGLLEKSTYYVLDAQGNTLSVYEHEVSASSVAYKQKERYIYGSSRIGVNNKETDMYATNSGNSNVLSHEMGLRSYELTNHLGNVLSVISDKVIPHPSGASVAYYKADILQSMDYSPFGVTLKGRNLKKTGLADLLRYGFNGMEKDDELKGEGNSYDFGARILDTRLGRWLSIDPQFRKYPDLCAYNFVANNPLLFVDPNGEEIIIHYKDADGNPKQYKYTPGIKPTVENQFVQQVHEAVSYVMKNDDEQVFQTISNDESKINIVETFTFDQFADKTGDWRFNYNSGDGKVNESSTEATISWNPLAMLVTTDGGGLAPSTALLHEADHARGFLALKTKAEFDAWKRTKTHYDESSPNFAFDDAEEKRVITGAERKYVNKVNSKEKDKWTKFKSYTYTNEYGYNVKATWWRTDYAQQQGIRNNHSGSVTKSKGVNSITRADGQRVLGEAVTYGRFIKKILGKS